MLSKHFKSEKGMALAVVLMVLAVLSILSVGALAMTQTENKLSLEEKESINSYAISKSGLEIVSKKLQKNPSQIAGLISAGQPLEGTIGTDTFRVSLSGTPGSNIKLISTGTVNGNSEISYLELINQSNLSDLFKNAVYSNLDLDLSDVNLSGPVQSAGTVDVPSGYDTTKVHANSPVKYSSFIIPSSLPSKGSLSLKNKDIVPINSDGVYGNIEVKNGGTLILGASDNANAINIVVDTLDSMGNIIVNSRVNLFVKDTMTIQAQADLNNQSGANADNLFIFLGTPDATDLVDGFNPNGKFHYQAGVAMNAYIYGPAAFVESKSKNASIIGGIICNKFESNSQPTIKYDPPTSNPGGLNGIINLVTKSKYTDQ